MSKAKNILSQTWVSNIKDINADMAADMVVKAEMKIKELLEEQANDEKLAAAKQIVKDLNSSYSSIITMEKARIAYLLDRITEIEDGSVNPTSSVG